MELEIQVLAWDRYKNVAGLNQLMGSNPPPSRAYGKHKQNYTSEAILACDFLQ